MEIKVLTLFVKMKVNIVHRIEFIACIIMNIYVYWRDLNKEGSRNLPLPPHHREGKIIEANTHRKVQGSSLQRREIVRIHLIGCW